MSNNIMYITVEHLKEDSDLCQDTIDKIFRKYGGSFLYLSKIKRDRWEQKQFYLAQKRVQAPKKTIIKKFISQYNVKKVQAYYIINKFEKELAVERDRETRK